VADVPVSLAPGETGAVKATARYADGSVRDVTAEALWTSSHPSIASIASGGVATGHAMGEALVSFRLGTMESGGRSLLVLPSETYLVSGAALAADGDAAILGAHVELLTHAGATIATATTEWGGYRFYGVPVDATLRVSRDGFTPAMAAVASARGASLRRSLDVRLSRVGARPDYSGVYELRVTASCQPGNPFPEALRHRRYSAVLTQDVRLQLSVQLSGADFFKFFTWSSVGTPGKLSGLASDDRARFFLGDSWDWGVNADLAEQLPNQTWLVIHGTADVAATPTAFVGTLDGSFDLYPAGTWAPSMSCKSPAHQFVLTR
jgi:hypothetical protein